MVKFIANRIKSFKPAFKGLVWLFQHEHNAKVHLFATLLVVTAGVYFHITAAEWIYLCFAIALVIGTEALNTSIEKLVDLLHPHKHEHAGLVKDLAAAAVLVSSIIAIIVAVIVFLPKF